MARVQKPTGRITPLWIVATFVSLTEVALAYAVTQTKDWVQGILTVFVVLFALGVASAFFYILWHRPYVFFSPSEYGDIDPTTYIQTIREVSPQIAALAESVEENPTSEDAKFALIDGMAEKPVCLAVIAMHESGRDLSKGAKYVFGNKDMGGGAGQLFWFGRDLDSVGITRTCGGGSKVGLTEMGHRFAKWLISKDRKADYFRTSERGIGWGEVIKSQFNPSWLEGIDSGDGPTPKMGDES